MVKIETDKFKIVIVCEIPEILECSNLAVTDIIINTDGIRQELISSLKTLENLKRFMWQKERNEIKKIIKVLKKIWRSFENISDSLQRILYNIP